MRMSRGWEITIKTGFVILLVGGMAAAAFADEKVDQVTDSFARAERRARSQSNWWRHKFKNDASFTNVVAPLPAPVPAPMPAFQNDVEERKR